MNREYGGLIFDDSRHYIDHLAPFCALQGWPLIVCEESIADLCKHYYPDLEVILESFWNVKIPETVVSCTPAKWLKNLFPHASYSKFLWLPHGQSDKGWKCPFFEVLEGETALVYGENMEKRIKKESKIETVRIGNFRLNYWLKHKEFYHQILTEQIPFIQETYLYSPTWQDWEGNSTFEEFFEPLLDSVPSGFTLIIKLHPNTERKKAAALEQWRGKWREKKNIFFLSNFPPIYPLLDLCVAYIGDMSSIGYDTLYFDRPLYLFKTEKRGELDKIAIPISKENIASLFTKERGTNANRKKLYEKTFHRSLKYSF